MSSDLIGPEKLETTPGSCVAQLEPKVGKANSFQRKDSGLVQSGNWGVGWLELREQRTLLVLELILPLYTGRESNP